MKFAEAQQRAREIQDASQGDTIPGDPDHGKWARVGSPEDPVAHPIEPRVPPFEQAIFPYPVRPLPPIAVAPDNLDQFNRVKGVPVRRIFTPKPI